MAAPGLIAVRLPAEPELQAFAAAAAQLLVERQPRSPGLRAVSRRVGVGLQHLDHRDYVPGDEVRHIDWRQTARLRRPILRRFESESVSDWTLLLDASSSMAVHGGVKWQAAVQAAAALSYALLQLGHRVGVLAFGTQVLAHCTRGRGQRHYAAIARLLQTLQAAPQGERSELGVCAPLLHEASSVFVLGDFLADDTMCRDLGALRQRCSALHTMQLRSAAETRLAPAGEVELVDAETGQQRLVLAGPQADAQALAARAAMTARLQAYCLRNGIAFTDWDVGQPWRSVLLQHLVRARANC
jgi:uncharacterized protein (DUF58 family)